MTSSTNITLLVKMHQNFFYRIVLICKSSINTRVEMDVTITLSVQKVYVLERLKPLWLILAYTLPRNMSELDIQHIVTMG